jgi:hypothetical protein
MVSHRQRQSVIGRIAEKIRRVREQGHRACGEAARQFDAEHRGIDPQRNPQRAPKARAVIADRALTFATTARHIRLPTTQPVQPWP